MAVTTQEVELGERRLDHQIERLPRDEPAGAEADPRQLAPLDQSLETRSSETPRSLAAWATDTTRVSIWTLPHSGSYSGPGRFGEPPWRGNSINVQRVITVPSPQGTTRGAGDAPTVDGDSLVTGYPTTPCRTRRTTHSWR
jgi:hypothetical protein